MKSIVLERIVCCAMFMMAGRICMAKPNIIYFNADDLGVMDVGFNARVFHTPNIDRLAREGMTFTESYAPASNCAPSRATCMSGQYAPRHGVYTVGRSDRGPSKERKLIPVENTGKLRDDIVTMAEALKDGGYSTIHLGKWHLGADPRTQGFEINIGGDESGGPYGGGYFSPWSDAMKPFNEKYPEGTHRSEVFASEAIKFMKEHKDGPFFMHMACYSVHAPLQAVKPLLGRYEGKNVNPVYATMVEKMDESIGKMVDAVDALGLAENTLILFSSDNGGVFDWARQHPYRAGKGSYFDGGIRVPMVARWPGTIEPGSRCATPVSGVDFFPTFLDAAVLRKPAGKILDGLSLMPLLTGKGGFPERALYWHFPVYLQGGNEETHDRVMRSRPGSVVRFGQWKLHEYFEDGRFELYDLNADHGERNNLVATHPEKVTQLKRMLYEWRASINAPVPAELNPECAKGGRQVDKKE